MTRKVLWTVLVIGLGLVIAPLAMSLPSKANAGQRMLNDFHPLMQPKSVQTTANYYYDVFVPLGKMTPTMGAPTVKKFDNYLKGFGAVQTDAQKLVPMLAQALHMTPAQVQQLMAKQLPGMTAMLQNLPQMKRDFGGLLTVMSQNQNVLRQVPAGLAHYKPLVDTMQGNVSDYRSVNSLPSFGLFAWFFTVPGVLLVVLSLWGLFGRRIAAIGAHPARPTPVH